MPTKTMPKRTTTKKTPIISNHRSHKPMQHRRVVKTKAENTVQLYVTKNYDIFIRMIGNRPINESHVTHLKKKIQDEGNLTSEFPINLNEKMEIIDGQHRIMALKQLGYPV